MRWWIAGSVGMALAACGGIASGGVASGGAPGGETSGGVAPLGVSEDGRAFVQRTAEGERPFFWLADTAWGLYKRSPEEVRRYLDTRAAQGFTVIQGPTFEWNMPGLEDRSGRPLEPLAYDTGEGHSALREPFLARIDFIVDEAAARGLYVALVPMWSDGMAAREAAWGHTEAAADLRRIGRALAERYASRPNVIWIAGGEAVGEANTLAMPRALGGALHEATGGAALIGLHPTGDTSSGAYLHAEPWLDFNLLQSGHRTPTPANYRLIAADRAREPAKPTLEGEIAYEGFDHDRDGRGDVGGPETRRAAYWSVFAGGAGFTYGHQDVWPFRGSADRDEDGDPDWIEALNAEGAADMIHLRRLMASRPLLGRAGDAALVLDGQRDAIGHVQAMRGDRFMMAYLPSARRVTLDTSGLAAEALRAWWYDPRTGEATAIGDATARNGKFTAAPPGEGDWVLVIDDAEAGYARP